MYCVGPIERANKFLAAVRESPLSYDLQQLGKQPDAVRQKIILQIILRHGTLLEDIMLIQEV